MEDYMSRSYKSRNVGTSPSIEQFYQKEKPIKKKQVSLYLDADVLDAFNEFGKANCKGAKSDLVNNFLKEVFDIRQGVSLMTEKEKELIEQILNNVHTNLNDFKKDVNGLKEEINSKFNQINQRLDRIIAKKEEENEEISNSLQRILKNF
jgi:hypothetical protein